MLYSFMGTCKLHGINPMVWMADVLKRINNHPPELMLEMLLTDGKY